MDFLSISSEYSITVDQVKGDVTIVHKFPRRKDDKGLISRDTRITIGDFETLLSVALFGAKTHFTPDAAIVTEPIKHGTKEYEDLPF